MGDRHAIGSRAVPAQLYIRNVVGPDRQPWAPEAESRPVRSRPDPYVRIVARVLVLFFRMARSHATFNRTPVLQSGRCRIKSNMLLRFRTHEIQISANAAETVYVLAVKFSDRADIRSICRVSPAERARIASRAMPMQQP
jgi:hypothetical protein